MAAIQKEGDFPMRYKAVVTTMTLGRLFFMSLREKRRFSSADVDFSSTMIRSTKFSAHAA